MRRDPKHDVLFEPVKVGPKVLKNRFCQTPHCSHFGVDLAASHAYLRATKAEGGWALVNTEYASVHPESDDYPHNFSRLWDDDDVRNMALMCDLVHEADALAGVELWYGGAQAANNESRLAARGVSQINSEAFLAQSCYEMSKEELRELQGFYVDAAKRARSAGFDVVNVYGGHFHTIAHQFLSPFYNHRTDEYGGSFENRARFWVECLELIREAVGDDLAIAARFGVEGLRGADGVEVEEDGVRFVEHADHLVDVWDLQVGTITNWWEDTGPSRTHAENFQAPAVSKVRPHTSKPIIGVGRFVSPDVMAGVVRSGQLDIVGAARPSIADPFLPRKIEEGRLDDIRECIGCNICIGQVWGVGSRLICTQNATVGEEYRRGWHPERFQRADNADKDVLLLGAGPAGLECARVLGERGMRRVHLVEAAEQPGGTVAWIPRLPGLGEWSRVVGYRQIQIEKLHNVELILKTRLEARDVLEYGAEIVVIATGSHWATDGLNGVTHAPIPGADASRPEVLTPEQIMVEGKAHPGERVVIYDCDGYFMAPSLAEKLAEEGKKVTLITPAAEVAAFMHFTGEADGMYRRLYALGVELVANNRLVRFEHGQAITLHHYDGQGERARSADALVLVTQRISDDQIYLQLKSDPEACEAEGVEAVYRIGDCQAPRLMADSIFDGHRLAREIDAPNPAIALPYLREHKVFAARADALPARPAGRVPT
jgi:dimethylamine/trimethylamine dehydrogenase